MRPIEYLLETLSEEAAEVVKCCTKANRFGLQTVEPGKTESNETRLWAEINDFFGALEKLTEYLGSSSIDRQAIEAKKKKIEYFMQVSRELGTLQ